MLNDKHTFFYNPFQCKHVRTRQKSGLRDAIEHPSPISERVQTLRQTDGRSVHRNSRSYTNISGHQQLFQKQN